MKNLRSKSVLWLLPTAVAVTGFVAPAAFACDSKDGKCHCSECDKGKDCKDGKCKHDHKDKKAEKKAE